MALEEKRWYNNPWLLALVPVALSSPFFNDLIRGLPVATTFKILASCLQSAMNYDVKLKWILTVGILILLLRWVVVVVKKSAKKVGQEEQRTRMLNHTAEKISGLVWTWDWDYNEMINKYEAKNAAALCPNTTCKNIKLQSDSSVITFSGHGLRCPNCQSAFVSPADAKGVELWVENSYSQIN